MSQSPEISLEATVPAEDMQEPTPEYQVWQNGKRLGEPSSFVEAYTLAQAKAHHGYPCRIVLSRREWVIKAPPLNYEPIHLYREQP